MKGINRCGTLQYREKLLISFNPSHATGLFRYSLKTSENLFSRGIERDQWHEMGQWLPLVLTEALSYK